MPKSAISLKAVPESYLKLINSGAFNNYPCLIKKVPTYYEGTNLQIL
jgi:hypothetical protein